MINDHFHNKKINSHLISNFKFVHFLPLFVDDPKECEVVDCTKDFAVNLCPKTCTPKNESVICKGKKGLDCSDPKISQLCPLTCAASTKGNHFC